MRTVFTTVSLALIAATGCATSGRMASLSASATEIVRAESDPLSELESATHKRNSRDETPKSSESKCKKCGKKPCQCGPRFEDATANRFYGQNARASKCTKCGKDPCRCGPAVEFDSENSLSSLIAFTLVTAPFTVPALLLNDNYDHFAEFPDHPYAEGAPGSLLIDNESDAKKQFWTGNLQAFAVLGSDSVNRFGGRLLLDSTTRFGVDTEAGVLTRVNAKGGTNSAWIGDANLVFRFAESEHVQMRAGVGVNWLADQIRPEAGFNFTYGIEWFPRKPWTISSVIDAGKLGEASLFHNRSTVGVMLGATEAFVGYDYLQVDAAKIHGPVAGVGWRF